jgi:hypothetical protein
MIYIVFYGAQPASGEIGNYSYLGIHQIGLEQRHPAAGEVDSGFENLCVKRNEWG